MYFNYAFVFWFCRQRRLFGLTMHQHIPRVLPRPNMNFYLANLKRKLQILVSVSLPSSFRSLIKLDGEKSQELGMLQAPIWNHLEQTTRVTSCISEFYIWGSVSMSRELGKGYCVWSGAWALELDFWNLKLALKLMRCVTLSKLSNVFVA